MRKILNYIIYLVFLVIFGFIIYIGYLLHEPFQPPTITTPIPILNKDRKIKQGESISTKIDYCVYKKVPSTSSRRYEQIGDARRLYFLSMTESAGSDPICGTVESNTGMVPIDIPPGHYKIILTSTFKVNQLKEVVVRYETEEFEIIKSEGRIE